MVVHFVCVLFTGFLVYTASPGSSLFSWHPALMTVAFCLIMMQGLLVFSPQSSLIMSSNRKVKTFYHWLLMISSTVLALLGYLVIFKVKEDSEKPHLMSWHAWIGLATIIYSVVQCLGGANILWFRSLATKICPLATWKLMHATSGLLLFILVTLSIITSLFTNWFVSMVTGTSWYTCLACPLILLLAAATQIKNAYLVGNSPANANSGKNKREE
ncbi:hypothetical protein HELRODRAFT_99384 [Helobdella robusta]|uniref:ascorbate ferrireductase (transmembrane) n=1 Tax=Helobdella robusta TaxID=6412 RepID=T1G9S4_HELRO|nr:hypothetical protein HELRODRAFT_99384 [Helobdella robusta]ESO05054.1 hypothetical protein HELRODRAFT_99384 [Helobdella robusta]